MIIEINKTDRGIFQEFAEAHNLDFKIKDVKFKILIEGDWNDGDYVTNSIVCDSKEAADEISDKIQELDTEDGRLSEELSEYLYDNGLYPSGGPDGSEIHTITEIDITEIV